MKEKCIITLLIGLLMGFITGFVLGFNLASWNFAGTLSEGYAEVIKAGDRYAVKYKGHLYKMEPIEIMQLEERILEKLQEHDDTTIEIEKAEILHDKNR